jgi:glycosyltransferase involved in cell wall biosynthesis
MSGAAAALPRPRVAIANVTNPVPHRLDFDALWAAHELPRRPAHRDTLFEQPVDWGFHIYALGVHMLDRGLARHVEFWDYAPRRSTVYHRNGVLKVRFFNEADVAAYLRRHGPPDLFINYGRTGRPLLELLAGQCFRVHVPCTRAACERDGNSGAECYLVDDAAYLDDRSMLYVPVVNTRRICPAAVPPVRDFIYLARVYDGKRHDLLLRAVDGTELTGHLHPVEPGQLDVRNPNITTSAFGERDVVELLRSSRIAVYAGDRTSNPAAMWECVAAGLPIVVNAAIRGGKHLVVPGVTGELASEDDFLATMRRVLARRATYTPRRHFEAAWDTIATLEGYLSFFRRMGVRWPPCF